MSSEDHPLLARGLEQSHEDPIDTGEYTKGDEERRETEKALLRKLDNRMSFLVLLIILNYVDRTNAAAARLRGFEEDLGLKGAQFSTVISIFYAGYIFMQVPSNMLLSQVSRPSVYLGCVLMAPGAITFSTGLVNTYHQALLARFLLGLTEAPFYCGAMFYLGRWYKRNELSERMAYLICGILVSVAFGTLIASFLLDVMDGILGLPAWRWLFLVEGSMTIIAAIAATFTLPDFPETKSISWLTPAEHMLARRRMLEDSAESSALPVNAATGFTLAVLDWKVWYLATTMFLATLSTSFMIFFPTITATMGYSATVTLLLCVPPWLVAAASSLWLSKHSDRMQERCIHVITPYMIAICGFLLAMITMNTAIRYVSLFFMAQASISDVVFFAWASSIVGDPPAKRAVALAFMNAIAQGANIAGSYVWVKKWGPAYINSFVICTVTCLVSIFMCLYLRERLRRFNREMDLDDESRGIQRPFAKGWRYHI